ncbi:hypothetical protein I0Q91_05650 [Halanaerobiaceae bacterium Z-7014]|uniref:Lipopolysaccharide kinase (Kdo/WaaP) family protein n=1 Tax=Halonatronomonas betaini TaxID=2778430 RepID=A0A931APJ2_9FIRM|nr:lipopolysaccharide kinase InaA family protein [Halonatronomonas betaini]MBF8436552.1 hypothetical protein [Halonatronomonas betaini]
MQDISGTIYYNKKIDDSREARLAIHRDNPLDFEKYLAEIPEIFKEGTSLVYQNSRNTIKKFQTEFGLDNPLIIKKFGQQGLYDNIRFRVSKSRAFRSFRAANWLEELNILIPQPYLAIEYRTTGNKLINSYYISEFVEFDFDLYKVYRENPLPGKTEQVISELGKMVSKIHNHNIIYGDLHPNNIHFVRTDSDSYKFFLIDYNRIKKSSNISLKQRAKDLYRLRIPDKYASAFFDGYDYIGKDTKLHKYIDKYYNRHHLFKQVKKKIRN